MEFSITTTESSLVTVEQQMQASDLMDRYGIKHYIVDDTVFISNHADNIDALDILMRENLGQFDVTRG